MAQAYYIKRWTECYETGESRRIKHLSWVPTPNRLDSKGLKRLLRRPDGLEVYGVFRLLVAISSHLPQQQRGWLVDGDGPMGVIDISDRLGVNPDTIENALNALLDPQIDWIELREYPDGLQKSPETSGHAQQSTDVIQKHPGTPVDCWDTGEEKTGPDRRREETRKTGPVENLRPSIPAQPGPSLMPSTIGAPAGAIAARAGGRAGPGRGKANTEERRAAWRRALDAPNQQTGEPPSEELFRVRFTSLIAEACQMGAAEYNAQLSALEAVAKRVAARADRADTAAQLIGLAVEKRAWCNRPGKGGNPWALWQRATNRLLALAGDPDHATRT